MANQVEVELETELNVVSSSEEEDVDVVGEDDLNQCREHQSKENGPQEISCPRNPQQPRMTLVLKLDRIKISRERQSQTQKLIRRARQKRVRCRQCPREDQCISPPRRVKRRESKPATLAKKLKMDPLKDSTQNRVTTTHSPEEGSLDDQDGVDLEKKPVSQMSLADAKVFIKMEAEKGSPDFTRLSDAMEKTFQVVRKPVYAKGTVFLQDVMQFPEMRHYQMVKEEYGRIIKSRNRMTQLEKRLEGELHTLILSEQTGESTDDQGKDPTSEAGIQLKVDLPLNACPQKKKVLGMLVLCFKFAGDAVVSNLCKILEEDEELDSNAACSSIPPTPTIVVREEEIFSVDAASGIYIFVDRQKFLRVPNIYEAVLCVFALYYVFNIDYDPTLNDLFSFFDKLNNNKYPQAKRGQ